MEQIEDLEAWATLIYLYIALYHKPGLTLMSPFHLYISPYTAHNVRHKKGLCTWNVVHSSHVWVYNFTNSFLFLGNRHRPAATKWHSYFLYRYWPIQRTYLLPPQAQIEHIGMKGERQQKTNTAWTWFIYPSRRVLIDTVQRDENNDWLFCLVLFLSQNTPIICILVIVEKNKTMV